MGCRLKHSLHGPSFHCGVGDFNVVVYSADADADSVNHRSISILDGYSTAKSDQTAIAVFDPVKRLDWNAPDLERRVNQHLHQRVIKGLENYRRDGNQALGEYSDKETPINVSEQFEYMLSYARVLPGYLPDFHRYLLAYPNAKSPNIEDTFYWAKVKFGLKPTLRVVQLVTFRGQSAKEPAYAIAEKQLYSSHYFETALDLTFCIRGTDDSKDPGFYLIREMGSEQAGLTGFKGSIVRKVAVGRSASSLEKSLAAIKDVLESKPVAKSISATSLTAYRSVTSAASSKCDVRPRLATFKSNLNHAAGNDLLPTQLQSGPANNCERHFLLTNSRSICCEIATRSSVWTSAIGARHGNDRQHRKNRKPKFLESCSELSYGFEPNCLDSKVLRGLYIHVPVVDK